MGGVRHDESPAPEAIRDVRVAAGLTQTEAARLLHYSPRGWQQWEAGDRGMHPAFWELFQIKAGAVREG